MLLIKVARYLKTHFSKIIHQSLPIDIEKSLENKYQIPLYLQLSVEL